MALLDRYGLRALVAAAIQIVLLVGVTAYGAWPPSLGTRLLWPTIAMLPAWAGLMWLTLYCPWDWGGLEPRQAFHRWWGYWEGGVVYGSTLGILRLHAGMFTEAKQWSATMHDLNADMVQRVLSRAEIEAWASDTFGSLILSGPIPGWWAVGGALAILALAWFLLPR